MTLLCYAFRWFLRHPVEIKLKMYKFQDNFLGLVINSGIFYNKLSQRFRIFSEAWFKRKFLKLLNIMLLMVLQHCIIAELCFPLSVPASSCPVCPGLRLPAASGLRRWRWRDKEFFIYTYTYIKSSWISLKHFFQRDSGTRLENPWKSERLLGYHEVVNGA
jgi:hypothetical protein